MKRGLTNLLLRSARFPATHYAMTPGDFRTPAVPAAARSAVQARSRGTGTEATDDGSPVNLLWTGGWDSTF